MGKRSSAISGGLGVLLLLATVVFSIAAQIAEPPLEPARTFIHWQALWDDGRYGPKYTFAVTWVSILAALFVPIAFFVGLAGALRDVRAAPIAADFRRIEWKHMGEGSRAALGLGLTGACALFGGACLVDAEVFAPVGFLARIALILGPFGLLVGAGLLLDVVLPASLVVGQVEALERVPGATPQQATRFFVTIGGRRVELPEVLWGQLGGDDVAAIRLSGAFDRVLELARRPRP